MVNGIIKQLRREAGLTQEQVAKKARTPRAYISQIENGIRSPSERLAEDILIKGIGLTYPEARKITNQWKLQKVGLPQELQPIAETEFTAIPILCSVPCGEPEEVHGESDGYISLPGSKIPKDHRIFALTTEGLSMMDENIAPGDIIICDQDAEIKNGDLAVVKVGDGFTLKSVYFKDEYVKLEPGNNGFESIETSQLEIAAKVIYIIKKC